MKCGGPEISLEMSLLIMNFLYLLVRFQSEKHIDILSPLIIIAAWPKQFFWPH